MSGPYDILSDRQLDRVYWFHAHWNKIILGWQLFLVVSLLFILSLVGLQIDFLLKQQTSQLVGLRDLNVKLKQLFAKDLVWLEPEIGEVVKVPTVASLVDASVRVGNPSLDFVISKLEYRWRWPQGNSLWQEAVIYPGQTVDLVTLAVDKRATFEMKQVLWRRLDPAELQLVAESKTIWLVDQVEFFNKNELQAAKLKFSFKNRSGYDFWKVPYEVFLLNQAGEVVSISKGSLDKVLAGQQRSVEVGFGMKDLSEVVDQKINLFVNLLDSQVYYKKK